MELFKDNETNNETKWNMTQLKIPTCRRRTSWLFYKRDSGFELWTTEIKIQLAFRASDSQVQCSNHSSKLPPDMLSKTEKNKHTCTGGMFWSLTLILLGPRFRFWLTLAVRVILVGVLEMAV